MKIYVINAIAYELLKKILYFRGVNKKICAFVVNVSLKIEASRELEA